MTVEAGRFLGVQVGSTAPWFLALLAVHIPAGLLAVATGAGAAATRKGSALHIRLGRWYYAAITAVFATAAALALPRWGEDLDLLLLGTLAFTAATLGYLHRHHHRPGHTGHTLGMGVSYAVMLTAFYIDNGPRLPLWDHLPTWASWLLPGAVAAPLIARSAAGTAPEKPRGRHPIRRVLKRHASIQRAGPGLPRACIRGLCSIAAPDTSTRT
jgi:hypothetical protein